ncbi:alpha-hydroxy-acid oxidizing protein, partial [Streptomyces sp. NPDC054933]
MSDATAVRTPRASADGPRGAALVNLADYREAARETLPTAVFDYLEGGAADEYTVRWNHEAYRQLALLPRVLAGQGSVDTNCSVFGTALDSPILLAPAASHPRVHPRGAAPPARRAAPAGAVMTVCTLSTLTV